MLILINKNILDIALDLIHVKVFHYLMVVDLVKTIFSADMSSFVHIDDKKKDILFLVKAQVMVQMILR